MIVVFILSVLWGIRIRGLWKLPDGRDCLWGKMGLVLMGGATLSKSWIQLSVKWGSGPCLLFGLRPNYGGSMKIMMASTTTFRVPDPAAGHCWPTPPLEIPGHLQASVGQSLVGSLLLFPVFWCTQGFVCALQVSLSLVLWKFCN